MATGSAPDAGRLPASICTPSLEASASGSSPSDSASDSFSRISEGPATGTGDMRA